MFVKIQLSDQNIYVCTSIKYICVIFELIELNPYINIKFYGITCNKVNLILTFLYLHDLLAYCFTKAQLYRNLMIYDKKMLRICTKLAYEMKNYWLICEQYRLIMDYTGHIRKHNCC